MIVTLKLDLKFALLTAILISIGLAALLLAFPGVSIWIPSNSSEMASWVQAIGSILAIAATWYIASSNDRKRQDAENRIAALEASTMYAELMSMHSSLLVIHSKLRIICRNPDEIYPQNILGIISEVLAVGVRPLSEQKDLAPVGTEYLSHYAELLRLIAIMKSDAQMFSREIIQDRDFAIVILEDIPGLMVAILKECQITLRVLRSFAETQGISLD